MSFIRRPSQHSSPVLKRSEPKLYVGIVVVVLVKLRTFTVVKLISITSPSAQIFPLSQSPIRILSLTDAFAQQNQNAQHLCSKINDQAETAQSSPSNSVCLFQ
jgi:hypothetical protein